MHFPCSSFGAFIVLACFIFAGCQTPGDSKLAGGAPATLSPTNEDVVLKEADVVKVSFPANKDMDTIQTIRVDGKITLPLIGEVVAAEKKPIDLQRELIKLYSKQIRSADDITVTVQSASFNVFVSGAVVRSGKVTCDHPMTVLEAIMQSGGFDYSRANLKSVRVIRISDGKSQNFTLNLEGFLNGHPIDIFYLRANDFVYVPTKFTWL